MIAKRVSQGRTIQTSAVVDIFKIRRQVIVDTHVGHITGNRVADFHLIGNDIADGSFGFVRAFGQAQHD